MGPASRRLNSLIPCSPPRRAGFRLHRALARLHQQAERFTLFVGAAVLANNLMIVAALLTKRSSHRRKAVR
jgi:hypothetical protein